MSLASIGLQPSRKNFGSTTVVLFPIWIVNGCEIQPQDNYYYSTVGKFLVLRPRFNYQLSKNENTVCCNIVDASCLCLERLTKITCGYIGLVPAFQAFQQRVAKIIFLQAYSACN